MGLAACGLLQALSAGEQAGQADHPTAQVRAGVIALQTLFLGLFVFKSLSIRNCLRKLSNH